MLLVLPAGGRLRPRLDLWCEAQDNWRTRNNFNGTPWLFCTIHNFGGNVGLGQGIIHAMTWYLKSTSFSRWGARPEGTVTEEAYELPEQTNWWLRAIRDQAVSNQDWPLNQVPREQRLACRCRGPADRESRGAGGMGFQRRPSPR